MKQHITSEQLNELGKRKINKIGKWIRGHGTGSNGLCLSIGQMIEFLDEHKSLKYRTILDAISENYPDDDGYIILRHSDEWCDALWEIVKEVLK